jgi:hypothetical protein
MKYILPLLLFFTSCVCAQTPANKVVYRGAMIGPKPSPEDVAHTVSLGANVLRYQIWILDSEAQVMTCKEYHARVLDYVEYFKQISDSAPNWIIDLHTPLGGYVDGEHPLFKSEDKKACTALLWKAIASSLSTHPRVLAFELLNEPLGPHGEVADLMDRLRSAVREYSRKPVIITTRHHNAEAFKYLRYYRDRNTWYAFHFYDPGKFTHHGIFTPSERLATYNSRTRKPRLEALLRNVFEFKRKHPKAVIWVTEFGASIYTEERSRRRWFYDMISIWEKNNINWTFHAIYECFCWSPFVHPSVANLIFARWKKNASN